MGRLKHEALREEVHCFDDPNLSEAAPTASAQITVQPCTCCMQYAYFHYRQDAAFSVPGSKPRTNSITLAEDICTASVSTPVQPFVQQHPGGHKGVHGNLVARKLRPQADHGRHLASKSLSYS